MILKVEQLKIRYDEGFSLHEIDFSMEEGEIISVIGESGSGKTTLAKGIARLNDANATASGRVVVDGKDIYSLSEKELKDMRQKEFAIALQNSAELLNPMLTVREHIYEVLKKQYTNKKQMEEIAVSLMETVGLKPQVLDLKSNELSGGMVQRIILVMSVALKPKFVILDEPTSALDVASKHKIVHLILDINKKFNIGFIVITHDFWLAEHISTKMMIFYYGHLVEQGITTEVIENPTHPYTRGLINASMDLNLYKDIWGIRKVKNDNIEESKCPFYNRCTQGIAECKTVHSVLSPHLTQPNRMVACIRGGIVSVIKAKGIEKAYGKHKVLKGVDIEVLSSEIVAVVGVSGSGKTTLSSILGGYLPTNSGEIYFENAPIDFTKLHREKGGVQMIFQDPYVALNQNMTVEDAVAEPLVLNYKDADIKQSVREALFNVGLFNDEKFLKQKIKNISGGQMQRIVIARALVMEPKLLIADEPTSMLDPSSKANLIRMLKGVQNRLGLSMLLITHDLPCAMKISDKIYMLKDGKAEYVNDKTNLEKLFVAET